eukprot:5159-Heterococcus_DN1.PRE.3
MFNNNVRLPGAANPLQMRPADSQTGHDHIAIKESKLFVGMLPLRIDETKLTELFQPFGTISEIYVMRDLRGGSKCASNTPSDWQALHAVQLTGASVRVYSYNDAQVVSHYSNTSSATC